MKAPLEWTNYSGGTYFVRVPASRTAPTSSGTSKAQDSNSTGKAGK